MQNLRQRARPRGDRRRRVRGVPEGGGSRAGEAEIPQADRAARAAALRRLRGARSGRGDVGRGSRDSLCRPVQPRHVEGRRFRLRLVARRAGGVLPGGLDPLGVRARLGGRGGVGARTGGRRGLGADAHKRRTGRRSDDGDGLGARGRLRRGCGAFRRPSSEGDLHVLAEGRKAGQAIEPVRGRRRAALAQVEGEVEVRCEPAAGGPGRPRRARRCGPCGLVVHSLIRRWSGWCSRCGCSPCRRAEGRTWWRSSRRRWRGRCRCF